MFAFASTVDGKEIVTSLARPLENKHGGCVGATNLCHPRRLGKVIDAEEIGYALSRGPAGIAVFFAKTDLTN